MHLNYQTKQSHDGAKFELLSNEVNDKDNKLAHEIHEQDEFERLLFDGADALRKVGSHMNAKETLCQKLRKQMQYDISYKCIFSLQEDPKFTRKVVQAVDRVGRILLRSNRINQFRCDFNTYRLISRCEISNHCFHLRTIFTFSIVVSI